MEARTVLYQRGDPILHIELRRWADLLLIAPLDANTLAKLAHGLADNCLTCVWRAWDRHRPVVLAPAMNTLMWTHPMTRRHLRLLVPDGHVVPASLGEDELVAWINDRVEGMHIVPIQTKQLACGDVGPGAMAEIDDILKAVDKLVGV
ncbi:MAG: hypothetical protein KatS3mg105_2543 [Gemmatales bacterium]|nr:MAG: hypothetical protein KatS3mg105_2543 [Gemmatales bacterium]